VAAAGRERILDAAEELLIDEGVAALTARRVAAVADVRPGLIHYHFESMSDLRAQVLQRAAERWRVEFEELVRGAADLSTLWRRWRRSMLAADEHRTFKLYIEMASFAATNEQYHDTVSATVQPWQGGITSRFKAPDPEVLAKGPATTPNAVLALLTTVAVGMRFQRLFGVEHGHARLAKDLEHWLKTIERS
jgi:AcrR family transcriptional regulator